MCIKCKYVYKKKTKQNLNTIGYIFFNFVLFVVYGPHFQHNLAIYGVTDVQWAYSECTVSVQWVGHVTCTADVQWVYSECTAGAHLHFWNVQRAYSERTVSVQWVYSACTAKLI